MCDKIWYIKALYLHVARNTSSVMAVHMAHTLVCLRHFKHLSVNNLWITYIPNHTARMCSLIRMLSFDVTNPWVDRSSTDTNSVYPNPRGFMSRSGRLNASSSGRDIMVSHTCRLESLAFTSMKVIRPVNGHTKQSSWSVRIRCIRRATCVRSFGDRFIRAQNLHKWKEKACNLLIIFI